jgi:hypothetical protein
MGRWPRDELERAFEPYRRRALEAWAARKAALEGKP